VRHAYTDHFCRPQSTHELVEYRFTAVAESTHELVEYRFTVVAVAVNLWVSLLPSTACRYAAIDLGCNALLKEAVSAHLESAQGGAGTPSVPLLLGCGITSSTMAMLATCAPATYPRCCQY
jgi:hypothetical protein